MQIVLPILLEPSEQMKVDLPSAFGKLKDHVEDLNSKQGRKHVLNVAAGALLKEVSDDVRVLIQLVAPVVLRDAQAFRETGVC